MSTVILIISVLAAMIIIFGGQEHGYGIILNVQNMTNTNTTTVNGTDGNATTSKGSVSEGDKMGSIATLPGKCFGSALCPD